MRLILFGLLLLFVITTYAEQAVPAEQAIPITHYTPISYSTPAPVTVNIITTHELTIPEEEEEIETSSVTEDEPYSETVAVPDSTPTSLGIFTITAYCDCEKCNGKWTGHMLNTPTQAGLRYPVVGYTVSVDPKVIPLGSVIELEGLGPRFAQDTGSAIKGNKIDLFMSSHEEALIFGVKQLEVWIYE